MKIKIGIFSCVFALGFLGFFVSAKAASLDSEEQKVIDLINNYRKENKLTELKPTESVQNAAEFMAEDFSNHPDDTRLHEHYDSTGRAPEERSQDYGFYFLTENIGWGYTTAEGIFEAWKASEGHRENMLSSGARTIGLARFYKAGATKEGALTEWFWIMDTSDEGVERLKGNTLKSSEFIDGKNYRKMSVTVKKKKDGKTKISKGSLVKVYDASSGRLIDQDLTDKKGRATLFTALDPSKIKVKVYKYKWTKKSSNTSKKIKWKRGMRYNVIL